MNGQVLFATLSAAALVTAFACGPRPRTNETAHAPHARANGNREALLTPTLDVDVTDGVRFDFRVTNTGDKKVEVNFPSGKTHELVVVNEAGHEVWRWSRGQFFTQSLQNRVLRSADALDWDAKWEGAPRGKYVAIASLASGNFPVEQRAEFTVR
ncbi:MAG: hypothetical protein HYR75_07415 [Gemmatimonadetes bacterium]|nr:hypothetical protein [Gemmatimonadota bacterium]MBI3567666.1 hypothetical protein [Gemmatimonadota bacterium]